MDKTFETRIVDEVYHESRSWRLVPDERPDFLCQQDGKTVLGIEVTDYFFTKVEARLEKIPGYPNSLLEGQEFKHKDDRDALRVETITYRKAGSDIGTDIKAILHGETPPTADKLARLQEIVEAKSDKSPFYFSKAPKIDLLINDSTPAFFFEKSESILRPFFVSPARNAVVTSPFREVVLLTKRGREERICIPLKANAFVAEVMLLEHLFKANEWRENADPRAFFGILILALASSGFGLARVSANAREAIFSYASIEYVYAREGKTVRDQLVCADRESRGDLLEHIARELETDYRARANTLLELKAGYWASVGVLYRAYGQAAC